MKGIKKFLSIIVLIVLIGTDFLNPISYAIEQEDLNFEINKNTDSYNENNIDIEDDSEEKNSYSFYIGEENKEGINIESEDSGDVDLDDGGLKLDGEKDIEESNLEGYLNQNENLGVLESGENGGKEQKTQIEIVDKTNEILEEGNKLNSELEFVGLRSMDNILSKSGEELILMDEEIGIKGASGSTVNDEPIHLRGVSGRGIMDQMPDFDYTGIVISKPDSLSSSYGDSPVTYVVMDRNLGASEPGRGVSSYGYLYQFGNNYGFDGEQGSNAINRREANINLTQYSNSNPYYSGVFVLGLKENNSTGTANDWAVVSNDNIRGSNAIKESYRQGPCPDGRHVPTNSEWKDVIAYWKGSHGGINISDFAEYFKLPLPGSLSRSYGNYYGSSYGNEGYYRTTTVANGQKAYAFKITSTAYDSNLDENRVNGYSIRCFKNDDTVYTITYDDGVNDEELFPDQSGTGYRGDTYPVFNGNPEWLEENREFLGWYKEVGGEYIQVDTETAQITSNVILYAKWSKCGEGECIVPIEEDEVVEDVIQDLDIYFVVDSGTFDHYTIQDRNPGATSNNIDSVDSYGYQYQWGNNHGFLSCGTNNCNSWPGGEGMPVSTLVTNALDYGPGNYYSGNVFITNNKAPFDWASPQNDNLWGDVTDALGDNPSARQGPCDAGYHVPSSAEWLRIHNAWLGVNNGNPNRCTSSVLVETKACAAKIQNDLLLPNVGRRDHTNGKVGFIQAASYWTSSLSGTQGDGFFYNSQETTASNALKFSPENRARARSVRCVKDVYNTPLTINIGGGTKAAVSVYGGKLHYLTNPSKTGYIFGGWYSSLTGNIKIEDGGKIKSSIRTLYAKWVREGDIEYKFYSNGGMFEIEEGEEIVKSDTFVKTYGVGSGFDLNDVIEPKRECYTFTGWYSAAEGGNKVEFPDIVTEPITVYAHWDEGVCGVTTGVVGNGSITDNSEGDYTSGKIITFTANPDEGYIFEKWVKNGEEILSGGSLELEVILTGSLELTGYFVGSEVEYYTLTINYKYGDGSEAAPTYTETLNYTSGYRVESPTIDGYTADKLVVEGTMGTGDVTVDVTYAIKSHTIMWLNEDGTLIDTTIVEYGVVPTHVDASQPPDVQYTYEFIGWTPTPTAVVGDASYKATYKYIKNKYTITWLDEDGTLINTTSVEYGTLPTHANPTKPSDDEYIYKFAGWQPELVTVVGDATYTATYMQEKKGEPAGGSNVSGGGGGNDSNLDDQHGSAEDNLDGNLYTGDDIVDDINEDIVPLYKWSYEKDITTMDTLEGADPDGLVTRGYLAKMVVNYMVNVLGREIPFDVTYECVHWGDNPSDWESEEIRDYATKACAFGVMGINMDDNKFLPNNVVTRAEFGTVVSRMLWGGRYNITDTDNRLYYEDHLNVLKRNNIMIQIENPEVRWEIRKWVWLVFRRVSKKFKK